MNPTISRTGAFAPSATARPVPDAQTAYEARACQVIKAPDAERARIGALETAASVLVSFGSPTAALDAMAVRALAIRSPSQVVKWRKEHLAKGTYT